MNQEEILYNHFLKIQTERYEKASVLLKERKFRELRDNFIHYVIINRKEKEIESGTIDDVIESMIQVKESLPNNADEPRITGDADDYGGGIVILMWNEYNLPNESTPVNLAKNYTRDAVFKLEHQPNGLDAKRYQKILDKYK